VRSGSKRKRGRGEAYEDQGRKASKKKVLRPIPYRTGKLEINKDRRRRKELKLVHGVVYWGKRETIIK